MSSGTFDYQTLNLELWNDRAPIHAASPDYYIEELVSNPTFISHVVDFDRKLLGDISGLSCVHLQCHIGTDTLSLARLGAASVTGVDFSDAALKEARMLAERTAESGGEKLNYVHASVESALATLPSEGYDLLYTGIGVLPWLSSVQKWAEVVSGLLKPGGRFFIREGHPILDAIEDEDRDDLRVVYPYFETKEPRLYQSDGTYVEVPSGFSPKLCKSGQFSHGLGEIVQALLDHGMCITGLKEHTTVPWNALPGHMVKGEKGEWSLMQDPERLPLSYTLQAIKVARG
ncbi:methyltransferase domain-containing protein [Thozetella sp. PMI_491]|nr:methyltransferase domain-containing protein [Thozetella sp. PMI_491]